jgi:hypothetical protein
VALLAESPYLRLALSPEIMRGRWSTRFLDPARLESEAAAGTGQGADVLCLESSYLQSAAARKLLSHYLESGHGVLLLVNRLTPFVRGCLRELGLDAESEVETGEGDADKFQFVLSNHPVFHPFLSPDYGNLMEVQVFKYTRLRATQAVPLVFSRKGASLLFQGTRTQGKLFVAAFGLDREHTSWPVHQTFIPFLDLVLQAARAEDPSPTSFEPGEIAVIQLPAGDTPRQVALRDEHRELARAPVDQNRVKLPVPDQPGVYTLSYDDGMKVEKLISVNPPPKESQLVYLANPEVMRSWQTQWPANAAKVSTPKAQIPLATILQQRWWWWMILAGLAALMLEMALAQTRKERA